MPPKNAVGDYENERMGEAQFHVVCPTVGRAPLRTRVKAEPCISICLETDPTGGISVVPRPSVKPLAFALLLVGSACTVRASW